MFVDGEITASMLQQAVANETGIELEEIEVVGFSSKAGSNKGDNFNCILNAVEVTVKLRKSGGQVEEKVFHYMAKCIPSDKAASETVRKTQMFELELSMYQRVLPALKKMAGDIAEHLSFPKVYFADLDAGVMIMENLKLQGFYMKQKGISLELDIVKMVLERLARLHATSFHMMQVYPGGQEALKKDFEIHFTQEFGGEQAKGIKERLKCMMDIVQLAVYEIFTEYGNNPELAGAMKAYGKVLSGKKDELRRRIGKFECLLHNDAWTNNFMFRNDKDEKCTEMRMLDLQMSRFARSTIELVYFFGSSTGPEFREKHLEEMLTFYHDTLMGFLNSYGYDENVYTYSDLKADFIDCFPFGYYMGQLHSMLHLPDTTRNSDASLATIMMSANMEERKETFMKGILQEAKDNKIFRERMVGLVNECRRMGIF